MAYECAYRPGDVHLGKTLTKIVADPLRGWHFGVDEEGNFHGLADAILFRVGTDHVHFGFASDMRAHG